MAQAQFPWYDSSWLAAYMRARDIIQASCPKHLESFIAAFEPFQTSQDFQVVNCPQVFSHQKLAEIRALIKEIQTEAYAKHEIFSFGRLVMQDLPYFNQVQSELTNMVSVAVGEEVEPRYNFLSLYNNLGVCKVHLDAPSAKWTLDVCIDQSEVWPIHFSQTVAWPENFKYGGTDWENYIKKDPGIQFSSYDLTPGNGIIFSGSSQWHYRDRIVRVSKENFCHLVFFHYIPKDTNALTNPEKWASYFNIPELAALQHYESRSITNLDDLFEAQN